MTVKVRWQQRRHAFVYPVPPFPGRPTPRTAILLPWFQSTRDAPVFSRGWCREAASLAPAAVAGSLEQIDALKGIAAPTHAVIVVARPNEPRVSETDRDRLWRNFRVPIFEQIVGRAGELLAAECEAHDGLHIESPRLRIEGQPIDTSPCACGRETPRLAPAEPAEVVRRIAAYAR